jgi:7-cyano-7-deazaguanine synthase
MAKRILVLHSGGMDSTTCLYKAKADGADVYSLGIDYGQRLSVELLFARKQCEAFSIPREVIALAWSKPDRQIPTDRDPIEMRASISPAFIPGRNVVLLSLACAHAAGISADEVHTGLNCIDFSGYPDCTVEFFESYRSMMAIANPDGARIVAPLLNFSKPEIASLARKLGIGEHDTWSCYQPQIVRGAVTPCGICDACRLHEHAWAKIK